MLAGLCLVPPSVIPQFSKPVFGLDKIVHFLLFFTLSVLWLLAKRNDTEIRTNTRILTLVLCVLYGYLIEVLQTSAWSGRSFELADVLADAIGALTGIVALGSIIKMLPFIKKRLPFLNHWYI